MPTNTSRASYDTFITKQWPSRNWGNMAQIQLSVPGTGDYRYGYVYFSGIPAHGATVFSATLRVWLRGSNWAGGPHTITVQRVTSPWKESALTWNSSSSGTDVDSTNSASASVTDGVNGQEVDIDVSGIMSDVASGKAWHGFQLSVATPYTAGHLDLYSSESTYTTWRPQLTVVWSRPPGAPTDLAPQGGAAVSLTEPTLAWSFKDPDGDAQGSYQVQIGTDSTFATPEFDSGWVTSGDHQIDLANTSYAGITAGSTRYWRVRVQDVNGLTSDWSTAASFTNTAKGTLAISNPPDGGYVEETTPPITTTLTGQAQDAIAYTLEVEETGAYSRVWSSGRFAASAADGTAFSFNVPAGKITQNGANYRLTVWSYDTVDREATPGDPVYVAAQSVFTFNRSSVPAPVDSLTVTPDGPGVKLTFARSTEPDYFALRVDGVIVLDELDPATLSTGTGTYGLMYYGATPNASHTFEVEAVVTDAGVLKHSESNPTQTLTPGLVGIWLVDDSEAPYVPSALPRMVGIDGRDAQDFTIGQSANVYYPIGRRDPVTITDSIRGLEGTMTGTITDDANGYVDAFRWAKQPEQAGRTWRLIYAQTNMPVQLGAAHLTPEPYGGSEQVYAVSVDVVQVGGF